MKKILITSGGCEEAIDNVRSISNFSTGKTGAAIAEAFAAEGWDVRVIHGKRSSVPSISTENLFPFKGWKDLRDNLKTQVEEFAPDAIVHAAAVSDYEVASVLHDGQESLPGEVAKIDSSADEICLKLRRTPKLIGKLRAWSSGNKNRTTIIGFKLTSNAPVAERKSRSVTMAQESCLDFVVSNDLSEINEKNHSFSIYTQEGAIAKEGKNKYELTRALLEIIPIKEEA